MAVGGVVELMHAKRIQGWAIDTDSSSSPVLDLCIEGHPIKRVKALRRRAGFERLVNNGTVGFRFRLHPSLLAYVRAPDAVTMRLNGQPLPVLKNSLRLLPEEKRRDPREISSLLQSGHIITKQGELRLSIRIDKEWQARHFGFYNEAREKFKSLTGYDLFLSFGALLGYVRDRELILTDDDLDTSYISRHTDPVAVKREFIEIHQALRDSGERCRIAPKRRMFMKWQRSSGSALIDIFPGFAWRNNFFMAPGVGIENGADVATRGVRSVEWYGYNFLVPEAAEDILAAAYGPGWKVYDPLFQWIIPAYAYRGIRRIRLTREEVAEANRYRAPGWGV